MGIGKGAYLKKITSSSMKWKTVDVSEDMDGTSPPSVFIGSWNYPKVFVGPMITPTYGDTTILDRPESWIPKHKTQDDIIRFRLDLVRGKHQVHINDFNNRMIQNIQEISLSTDSVQSEAKFKNKPRGFSFNEEHQPFGPSAQLAKFDIGNVKWEQHLEKVYYDTDFKAAEAVADLYKQKVNFSQIQKAFSTGTMGTGKKRKLVPTRWSITAVDSTLANHLFNKVKYNETIHNYQIYEFESLNNYYAILLTPTPWQYEWLEAFIHVMGKEELIFGDHEQFKPKKEYSSVGGCYYSCKFGVLEALDRMKKQSGAIIFREAYEGYVPLGVFNVRENVRNAMKQKPRKYDSFRDALNYISTQLRLPISRFIDQGVLVKEMLNFRQTTLR